MRGPFNFRRQNSRDWLVACVSKVEGRPVPAPKGVRQNARLSTGYGGGGLGWGVAPWYEPGRLLTV